MRLESLLPLCLAVSLSRCLALCRQSRPCYYFAVIFRCFLCSFSVKTAQLAADRFVMAKDTVGEDCAAQVRADRQTTHVASHPASQPAKSAATR